MSRKTNCRSEILGFSTISMENKATVYEYINYTFDEACVDLLRRKTRTQ